jgi:hypothetical protein
MYLDGLATAELAVGELTIDGIAAAKLTLGKCILVVIDGMAVTKIFQ